MSMENETDSGNLITDPNYIDWCSHVRQEVQETDTARDRAVTWCREFMAAYPLVVAMEFTVEVDGDVNDEGKQVGTNWIRMEVELSDGSSPEDDGNGEIFSALENINTESFGNALGDTGFLRVTP